MAIESNILFRIGSKATGGFTELKSAIDLLGGMVNKVKEVSEELDRFSQMWQRTNQAAVMAADSAAGGLVDTGEVLRGYQRLMQAGVDVTDQQFATITARAAEMAQATGTDATQAFQRLTNSIAKGSTRALKEYGVNAKEGGDLTEMHKAAVEGLTEGFEGLTVKAETTTERMYALENNLGTISSLLYEAAGASDTFGEELDSLNSALGEFASWLAESPKTTMDFIFSLKGMTHAAQEAGRVIIETLAGPFLWIEEKLNSLGGITGPGTLQQALDEMIQEVYTPDQGEMENFYNRRNEERVQREAAGIGQGNIKKFAPTGSRSKGKKKSEFDMEFTAEQTESSYQSELGDLMGPSSGSIKNLTNEELAERIELEGTITELWDKEAAQIEEEKLAREQLLDLAREEQEQKQEAREREIEQAAELRESWMHTYDQISSGAQKSNKWIGVMSKGLHASIDAAVSQEKNAGAAIAGVLGEVGGAISEEAGWQVLMETAKAIAAAASQNYAAAAAHGAAAIAFGVAAARSGGGGGAKAPTESTAARYSERFAGGGPSPQGGGGDDGGGSVTINIQMKEGAGGFFDALVEENDRANIDGRRSFEGN